MYTLLIGAIDVSINIGPIKLSLVDILLHLLNLVILIAGLTFLLYKPILKFIKKRQENIQAEIQKSEDLKSSAEEMAKEYESKLTSVEEEAEKIKAQAKSEGESEKEKIIQSAKDEATALLSDAKQECVELRKETVEEMKSQVTDAVIQIATEVVRREVTAEDNKKIIDEMLNKWSE